MKPKKLIANFKMNGNKQIIKALINRYVQSFNKDDVEVILCPAFVYLDMSADLLNNYNIKLGAQDICEHIIGTYTGEVSGEMLKDINCEYVIIGHFERRKYYKETNEQIAQKIKAAARLQITPIICVGESLVERKRGDYLNVIMQQLINYDISALKTGIIAYEPIWSIGTSLIPKMDEIEEVLDIIKRVTKLTVIYGGSVDSINSKQLLNLKYLDGLLVGGASLRVDEFINIYKNF